MLLIEKGLSDDKILKISLVNYGVYRAYNHAARARGERNFEATVRSTLLHIQDAAVGLPVGFRTQQLDLAHSSRGYLYV